MDRQQLVDAAQGRGARRMILRIAQRVVHQHDIDHRRKDGADAVLAVQPFLDEGPSLRHGAGAQPLRKHRLDDAQRRVDAAEQQEPGRALMRRLGGESDLRRRREKQFVNADAARVLRLDLQGREHHQRHHGGARPIRNLGEMKRRPPRQ